MSDRRCKAHVPPSALLLLPLVALAAQGVGTDGMARARGQAFFEALASGSPERFEQMARENYAPALLARANAAQRREIVQRVTHDFTHLTLANLQFQNPETETIQAKGSDGEPLSIALTLERESPYRITRVRLTRGGGETDANELPPAPIAPSLTTQALGRALDGYLSHLATQGNFSGTVLVARSGDILFVHGYGLANRDRKTPNTPDTLYNVGSIGKIYTTVAIGQLIEAGMLKLTDTIGQLLPDYPNVEARSATVDQLLNRTAGIADFFGPQFAAADRSKFRSNADYYHFVAPQPLMFPPGTRYHHCNGCYVVLGAIIEHVTHVPYESYIAEHVFKRAGMAHAGFLSRVQTGVAIGYTRSAAGGAPSFDSGSVLHDNRAFIAIRGSAAGGSYARVTDLLAFDQALRAGRLLNHDMTHRLLFGPVGPPPSASPSRYTFVGGAPGINAVFSVNDIWTVVVEGNWDPPNAQRVSRAILTSLVR